jgi:hypothetical protein
MTRSSRGGALPKGIIQNSREGAEALFGDVTSILCDQDERSIVALVHPTQGSLHPFRDSVQPRRGTLRADQSPLEVIFADDK